MEEKVKFSMCHFKEIEKCVQKHYFHILGVLIAMRGNKFIVDFGRRQLLIELADLRLAQGPSK